MAEQGNYQKKQKKKTKKNLICSPVFLAENFCGWAGHWDILKDELPVIAVVLDKNLNY